MPEKTEDPRAAFSGAHPASAGCLQICTELQKQIDALTQALCG